MCVLTSPAAFPADSQPDAEPAPDAPGHFRVAWMHVAPDDSRGIDDGTGFEVAYGRPWTDEWSWDVNLASTVLETGTTAGTDYYQTAIGFDAMRALGSGRALTTFVAAGAGFVKDDVQADADDNVNPYVRVGAGFLTREIGNTTARLRAELRYVHDDHLAGANDWQIQLGAVFPLGKVRGDKRVVERVVYRESAAPPVQVAYLETPERDADSDGVVDNADRCASTLQGAVVDDLGCIVAAQHVELTGVGFEFGSARLTPNAEMILEGALRSLRDQPGVRVEIAGHTDSVGSDPANLALSEARAETVRRLLVGNGIDGSRLSVRGYGETQPLAPETTNEGRAHNRRVEFRIEGVTP